MKKLFGSLVVLAALVAAGCSEPASKPITPATPPANDATTETPAETTPPAGEATRPTNP